MIDRVLERAATPVDLKRVLVWIVVAVPFALAWLAGKVVLGLAVMFSWVWAAMLEGYRIARGDR